MSRQNIANKMTEAELQSSVIELAQWLGYLVMHTRPAQKQDGTWITPIQGDAGYPDLTMVHKHTGIVLFAELKTEKERPTTPQLMWLGALKSKGFLWRPSQWLSGEIESILKEYA